MVDNASKDGAVAISSEFPRVHLIANSTNLGFGAANNQALRATGAPLALLLNNDASISETDLADLVLTMEETPRIAALGPVLTAGPNSEKITAIGGRDVSRHIRTHLRPEDLPPGALESTRPIRVRYLPGAIALVRIAALEEAGYFEERYFFGGELADYCEIAAARGHEAAVLPSARGWHDMSESDEHRRRLYPYYILRNRFLFVRRHRRARLLPLALFWTAYGLAAAGRDLARGNPARARLSLLAVADGLVGRFGNQNRRVLGASGAETAR